MIVNAKEAQAIAGKIDISFLHLTKKRRPKPGGGYFDKPVYLAEEVKQKAKEYFYNLPDYPEQVVIDSAIVERSNSDLLPPIQK